MILKPKHLIAVTIILLAWSTSVAIAQQPVVLPMPQFPINRTITVLATGSAGAEAQRVSLGLTVSSADQTATGLFVKQEDIVKHLKEALENAGISASDITEQPFHLMPNMEYGQNGTRIIGYRLDTPLEVELDNVKDLPRMIDLATQSGASAISVGAFGGAPGRSLHGEAVKNAIENARTEASAIAKEMGITLGDIASISEEGSENAAAAAQQQGGEEEERREMKKTAEQPNTLSEKANLKVVFEVR
ncbi:MAG TPA: SIMPL domain-containing protein [Candidatus Kapabacteria bacterium]|nr:SIMPL domain-containing protein [Candidatus Kapabacteria bacterium]